jgi:hypothetical protein
MRREKPLKSRHRATVELSSAADAADNVVQAIATILAPAPEKTPFSAKER